MINPTMRTRFLYLLMLLAAALLSACAGSSETRVTQGSAQIGNAPTGTVFAASAARIVHVDKSERLATIQRGQTIPDGTFLQAVNRSGDQTGLLKIQPMQPIGLRTAYILEGNPAINDVVSAVSAAESSRLEQRYPEGDAE